jgi:hypothetical protein
MLVSVLGVVLVALVVAAGATAGLGFLLAGWHFWRVGEPIPRASGDASLSDPVKIALTIVAGIGGVVALVVAYRKQAMAERVENRDRYGAAVTQLGNPDPTVRLAGVYAMANLADEWKPQRQQCVDVLCAYLRMPWDPDAESQHPLAVRKVETRHGSKVTTLAFRDPHGESQVRATILRIIADHLQDRDRPAWWGKLPGLRRVRGGLWSRLSFDLSGASLADVDMRSTVWLGQQTRFDGAMFSGEETSFDEAMFSGKETSFEQAMFSGDKTSFVSARFSGDETRFSRATFSAEWTSFGGAWFSAEWTWFNRATFSSNQTQFAATMFFGSLTSFYLATFLGEVVGGARFTGSRDRVLGYATVDPKVLDGWIFDTPDVAPPDGESPAARGRERPDPHQH